MKLLLHIGMHKTGTSALQALFRTQSDALLAQGVLYPVHGRHHDGAHHGLWHALSDQGSLDDFVRAVWTEAETAQTPIHTILLSSELLEKTCMDPARWPAMQAFLDLFDATDILYFMRNQGELIESIYKQWIKDDAMRVSAGPSQFIARHEQTLHYDRYADVWGSVAPKVTLKCARYDGDWHTLWDTFSDMSGLTLDASSLSRVFNPSMDGQQLKLKHWVNRNVPQSHVDFPLNPWLKRNFPNEPKTSMFRDQAAYDAFQSQYQVSNERLARVWGVEGLETGRISDILFQTASPELVSRFMTKLSADPETSNSLLLQFQH